MSATDLHPLPPPLLRAAAHLRRAGERAAAMGADLDRAAHALREALEGLGHESPRLAQVEALLSGARVRLLDARTSVERLPMLASEAEQISAESNADGSQADGSQAQPATEEEGAV